MDAVRARVLDVFSVGAIVVYAAIVCGALYVPLGPLVEPDHGCVNVGIERERQLARLDRISKRLDELGNALDHAFDRVDRDEAARHLQTEAMLHELIRRRDAAERRLIEAKRATDHRREWQHCPPSNACCTHVLCAETH